MSIVTSKTYGEWGIALNHDLFKQIRFRLTLLYTILMMIFLAVAMFISYYALSSMIYQVKEEQLRYVLDHPEEVLKSRDTRFLEEYEDDENEDDDDHDENEYFKEKRDNQSDLLRDQIVFLYLTQGKGSPITGKEPEPAISREIREKIQNWRPHETEYKKESIHIRGEDEVYLLMAAAPRIHDGKMEGYIYAGNDVTEIESFLTLLKWIMIALSLLFVMIAAAAGNYMAGKAMIPIKKSFQRQRQFVADASHELRTPLSVMQASLEVLQKEEENQLTPFSQQVLEDMKDETRRMTRLVQHLLTLARMDSGALEINRERFDLIPVVHNLLRKAGSLADKKRIVFHSDIADETLPVYADRERITQLLYILLDNAVKYTPEGGEVSIEIRVNNDDRGKKVLEMSVADTGIGIPEEEQSQIFKRFYRVDKARSRELGGTGLGLSIASWIVEAHRGMIQVESKPGEGSKFVVRIPLVNEKGELMN